VTGNLLIDSAISLAGIVVLVLLIRLLFAGRPAPVDAVNAGERLAFDEPDFEVRSWAVDKGGRAALAIAANGEAALIARVGGDLVTRRFRSSSADIVSDGDRLIIGLSDLTAPRMALEVGPQAAELAAKLSRQVE